MKRKWLLLLGLMVLLISGCASSTAEMIEVNEDKIPSIYKIIGEKKIVGTNSSVKNKVRSTEITYKQGSISLNELADYMKYLTKEGGFLNTIDTKEEDGKVINQVGKESKTEGNIVLVDLIFPKDESGSVVLVYRSGPGKITKN